ncbi:MAG: carbonic anhydrase family protein [Thiohalocapsa sp.]
MSKTRLGARCDTLFVLFALLGADVQAWQSDLGANQTAEGMWSHVGENGPERWGELSPKFAACALGRSQSPVSLNAATAMGVPCHPLRFRYRSSSLHATNDGQALRLGYDRGSYLVVDGLSYELIEVRFHVPAEHVIDGRLADAELQLIHGNNLGDIAVVAVPVIAGRRVNQIFRRILDNAPSKPGERYHGCNVGVNALFLLPGRKAYLAYQGSLTRPPCTEGIRWYVLRDALEVDVGDLRRLAQLGGPNARPIQPLEGRQVVKACEP